MNNTEFKKGQEVWVKFKIKNPNIDKDGDIQVIDKTGWKTWVKPEEIVTEIPEKPVVPQVAVEFYENYKDDGLSFAEWFGDFYSKQAIEDFPRSDELCVWLYDNKEEVNQQRELALATLIANGIDAVEVEQEKLYNVIVADQLLVRTVDKGFHFYPINYTLAGHDHRFTEHEIKSYEPKLMEFAKEVE